MFDCRSAAGVLLHSAGDSCRKVSGKERILGIVFIVSSAADIPMDIECRSQPEMDAKAFHFITDKVAALFGKPKVPALRQCCADRNRAAVLFMDLAFGLSVPGKVFHKECGGCRHQFHDTLRHIAAYPVYSALVAGILPTQAKTCRSVCHNKSRDSFLLQAVDSFSRRTGDRLTRSADHAS